MVSRNAFNMNGTQPVSRRCIQNILLLILSLVGLTCSPTNASNAPGFLQYQPTPPPTFDQSGRSVSNKSSAVFGAEGLFCAECYNALVLPSDMSPMIQLLLSFGTSYTRNARIENLFNHPVLFQYSEYYYLTVYKQVIIPAHSISPIIWLNPQYFQLSSLMLYNFSMTANKTTNLIWKMSSLSMWTPYDPSGMTHSDFFTITLMKSSCKVNLRGERFQIVLADRRQHSSLSPPPASDLQFIDCLPRGAIGTGYICPINITGIMDPDAPAQSPLSAANWLFQFYIYELRRYDTFKYMSNTTIITPAVAKEYVQVSSSQPWINSTLPARFPVQFVPVVNVVSYIPSPHELHQYIATDDGWSNFPQIESDVCDAIKSQAPGCYALYPHSGIRLKGVFSTCPLDIHLCGLNDDQAYVLGTVSPDGRTVNCMITMDVWRKFNLAQEVYISISYFPADRGYHSLADEATARADLADEARRTAAAANNDPDSIIEAPKMAIMEHEESKTKHRVSSTHSRLSFAKREKIAPTTAAASSASATTNNPNIRLTRSQMKHPHAEYIMQLLQGTTKAKLANSSTASSSSWHRFNLGDTAPNASSSDPYAWSPGDFAVPFGGYTLRPSSTHPRMFIATAVVGDNPFEVAQKQDSIRYFITSNVCIATGILVCISLFLFLSCALLDRLEDKCPNLRRRMRQMQQQQRARPQRAAVAPEDAGIGMHEMPNAVALLSEDGGDAEDREEHEVVAEVVDEDAALARRLQAAEEDSEWMWHFDFSLESKIDRQVKRLIKQQQKLAEKTAKKTKKSSSSTSMSTIPTSTSFSTSSSSSSSHRKVSNAAAPVSSSLGVPLLHSDDGVLESKDDWEAASSSYRPPAIMAAVHSQPENDISDSTYSAM